MKVCKVFTVLVNVDGAETAMTDNIAKFLNELKEIISVTQSLSALAKGTCSYLVVTIIGEK